MLRRNKTCTMPLMQNFQVGFIIFLLPKVDWLIQNYDVD